MREFPNILYNENKDEGEIFVEGAVKRFDEAKK